MAHLHSKQIMHGDLKAANVLLVNSVHGSFGQIAKLTDFGLAGVLRNGVTHHTTQHLGTITHCAPEILQDGRLSPAADVYAFGIMSKSCRLGLFCLDHCCMKASGLLLQICICRSHHVTPLLLQPCCRVLTATAPLLLLTSLVPAAKPSPCTPPPTCSVGAVHFLHSLQGPPLWHHHPAGGPRGPQAPHSP
jgi:serine/threonine protein kinase